MRWSALRESKNIAKHGRIVDFCLILIIFFTNRHAECFAGCGWFVAALFCAAENKGEWHHFLRGVRASTSRRACNAPITRFLYSPASLMTARLPLESLFTEAGTCNLLLYFCSSKKLCQQFLQTSARGLTPRLMRHSTTTIHPRTSQLHGSELSNRRYISAFF